MDLDDWLAAVSAELDTSDYTFDNDAIHTLLDLARDAAHEVARPAAPLTTFLIGLAVGRGAPLGAAAAGVTALAIEHGAAQKAAAAGEDVPADDDSPEG